MRDVDKYYDQIWPNVNYELHVNLNWSNHMWFEVNSRCQTTYELCSIAVLFLTMVFLFRIAAQISVIQSIANEISGDTDTNRKDPQIEDCFKKWYCRVNKLSMIRCEACYKNPAIVNVYRNNRRLPNITKECGAYNRKETAQAHVTTLYHQKSIEVARRQPILAPISVESNPIAKMVAKANLEKANEMGAYAITIFNDAPPYSVG